MTNNKIIFLFISIFLIFTTLLSAKESDRTFSCYTVFTAEKNSPQNNLLSYINSTSSISAVTFLNLYEKNIANVSKNSELTLHNCSISYTQTSSSLFVSSGKVSIDNIAFLKDFNSPTATLPTFVEYPLTFSCSSSSCINIQKSEICNAIIKKSEGTMLSKGKLDLQNVKNCYFYNLTVFDKNKEKIEDEITKVSFCVMNGTNMEKVDDFIYGGIISGLSLKTLCNFECNNNTFNNCKRRSDPYSYNEHYLKKEIKYDNDNDNDNDNNYYYYYNNNNIKYKNEGSDYSDQHFDNKSKPERDVSCSFTRCNFTNCVADGSPYYNLNYGGALYVSKSSITLSVISCLFDNCSCDSYGGAIFCENISHFTSFSSNFTSCRTSEGTVTRSGSIYVSNIKICCEINLCLFLSSSSSGIAGAVNIRDVKITGCSEDSPCSEGPINNCLFDNCSCKGNGGAMFIEKFEDIFTFRNLSFKDCIAISYGGAFYCDAPTEGSYVDCKFEGNKVFENYGGNDVFLNYNHIDEVNPFVSSYSSSGPYRVCLYTITEHAYKHFIDAWLPPFAKYVGTNGKDEDGCGTEDNPCLTIDYLVKKASEVNASNYFLSILHDLYILDGEIKEIHESALYEHELSLIGRSKENSKISVSATNFDGNNLITLGNGTISVKDLTFLLNSYFEKNMICMNDSGTIDINNVIFLSSSVSNDYSGTLIDASQGKIHLENVEFNSYNLSSEGRIMKCSNSFVSLSSISFISIDIERIDYSVVYCSFGDEGFITLTNISVHNSNLSEFVPFIKVNISGTLNWTTLNNITYENTEQSNGTLLSFVCSKKNHIPPLSSWGEIAPTLEENNEYYYKVKLEEKNITFAYVHYLYDVVKNEDDEYVLYSDGTWGLNIDNCGWKDLHCETLDPKFKNYEGRRRIILYTSCLTTSTFENIENEFFIEGEDFQSTVTGLILSHIETEGNYYFTIDNSNAHLNFTKLLFDFNDFYKVNVSGMNGIVSVTSGKVSFYNCSISPSLPISFASINISSSSTFDITLCLQNIEYQSSDISLVYSPSSTYTSSSLTLNLNISNVTNSLPASSFSNAVSSSSIISFDIKHTYIIKGNVSCSSENCLNGGALYCLLKDNGLVHLSGLSVSDCKTSVSKEEGKEGRGGFLYLDCSEKETDSFEFDDSVVFGDGNDATYGKNLFIKGNDFYNSVKEEVFPFINVLHPSFENNMNDYIGTDKIYTSEVDLLHFLIHYSSDSIYVSNTQRSNDVIGCGSDNVPCKSLNYGMNNLKEGENKKIIVKEKVEVDSSINLSGITVSSFDTTKKSTFSFSSTIKVEDVMYCSILNLEKLSLSGLHFPLFSSFSDERNAMFISYFISSNGELSVDNCEFSLSPLSSESIINYTIIFVSDGNLIIDLLSINSLSFCDSFSVISFDGSSELKNDCYLKENKIRNLKRDFDTVNSELKRKDEENRKGNEDNNNDNINLRNCVFNNITKNKDKPSCLNIKAFEDKTLLLTIDNTSFIHCSSVKDNSYVCNCERSNCVISSSSFSGISSDEVFKWNNNEELIGMICDWNEGMAVFTGGNVNIKDCSVINSSLGGLSVKGGSELSLDNVLFDNNKRIAEGYKSVRKNVVCESSSVNLISLKEKKEIKSKRSGNEVKDSLWILNKGCESKGLLTEYSSSFFIPSLNTVTYSSSDVDDTCLMNFTGTNLIPCNLSFEIRIRKEEDSEYRSLFGGIVRFFNETCCEGKFDKGEVGMWSAGDYLSVVFYHGTDEIGGGGEEEEHPVQNTKKTSSFNVERIIWILVSVILFLLLVLAACVITYLCCYLNPNIVKWREDRKRRGKKREHYDEIEDMLKKGNKEMGKENYKRNNEGEKNDNKIGTLDNIGSINMAGGDNNMDNSDYPSYTAPQM